MSFCLEELNFLKIIQTYEQQNLEQVFLNDYRFLKSSTEITGPFKPEYLTTI